MKCCNRILSLHSRFAASVAATLVYTGLSLLLSGCGLLAPGDSNGTAVSSIAGGGGGSTTPVPSPAAGVVGHVQGGDNPIIGGTVTLYATANNGVATNGVYVGTATVLGTAVTGLGGDFNITGATPCSSPDMMYITVSGGSSGSTGLNNNALLMAVAGNCPTANAFTWVNEVTTVATAYALSSFTSITGTGPNYTVNVTSDPTNYATVSSVTPFSAAGLAHAMLNAQILANPASGAANTTSPYSNSSVCTAINASGACVTTTAQSTVMPAIVPVAKLNTIAIALQQCVNSAGPYPYLVFPGGSNNSTVTLAGPSDTIGGSFSIIDTPSGGSPATYPVTVTAGSSLASAVTQINNAQPVVTASASSSTGLLLTAVTTTDTLTFSGTSSNNLNLVDTPATDTETNCGILFTDTAPASNQAISFTTPTAPTGTTGATANINNFATGSGTVSISLAGGSALTGTVTGTSPTAFVTSFNNVSSFSSNNIVASASDNTIVITGPAGLGNTLSFTGTSLSGTLQPSNTLQAMINLAKSPYTAANYGSTGLYSLVTGAAAAFSPNLSAFPPDWTLQVEYAPAYVAGAASTTAYPYYLTVDAYDTVYAIVAGSSAEAATSLYSISSDGYLNYATGASPSDTATATATETSGSVTSSNMTITSGGSGYITAPVITFTNGGCATEPVATTILTGGAVSGFNFTNNGSGCTSGPTATIAAPSGGGCPTGKSTSPNGSGGGTGGAYTCTLNASSFLLARQIAADGLGNVWAATNGLLIPQINASNGEVIAAYDVLNTALQGVAVDSSNNVWFGATSTVNSQLVELPYVSGSGHTFNTTYNTASPYGGVVNGGSSSYEGYGYGQATPGVTAVATATTSGSTIATGTASTTITYGGAGYVLAPSVIFAGCTTEPVGTANISGGAVQSINVTTAGSGCSSPTISFGTNLGAYGLAIDKYSNIYFTGNYSAGMGIVALPDGTSSTGGSASPTYANGCNSSTTSGCNTINSSYLFTVWATGNTPYGLALDASGNIWTTTGVTPTVYKITPTFNSNHSLATNPSASNALTSLGSAVSPITTVGTSNPRFPEVDGNGVLWTPDPVAGYGVKAMTTSATVGTGGTIGYLSEVVSGDGGYQPCTVITSTCVAQNTGSHTLESRSLMIDSTGSVWHADITSTNGYIIQMIGTASPTWWPGATNPGVMP